MGLREILEDFDRTKEKIKNRTRFKVSPPQNHDGLSMAIAYSDVMEYVVRELFDLTVEQLNNREGKGIAAFLYGSP